jgi:eukaryotic-like serine/threonine-protein kinase
VSRHLEPDVADGLLHGKLSDRELSRALQHAAGCADCRRSLVTASQPEPELDAGSMAAIQDRLTTWRAARRAPLMPAFPWPKGHEVDRYVIIRSVGGTEDGVIYEAFDPERDDRVVVKQLDLHVEDPATPALMAIARQLCQLSHPNLLQMLSYGVHAGFVYVVYEFVKGTPLSQAGGDDPQQIIELFAEAARGLAAAHTAGIVHGGFSAASCVVGRDGKVKVLDFGVGEARVHRIAATRTTRDAEWTTASSQVSSEDSFVGFLPARRPSTTGQFESFVLAAGPNSLGPRIYAAPELVTGSPPSPSADQFALCAALYHRLYGVPPIAGDTIALWLRDLLKGRIARPPVRADVPAGVAAALLRGLSREPTARFDDLTELVARLSRRRPGLGDRRRTIAGIAIAGTLAATGLVIVAELGGDRPSARAAGRCDRELARWDDLWSVTRQAELTQAGGAAAAQCVPALAGRIDAWLASWRAATHGFCRLPEARGAVAECAARAHAAATDLLHLVTAGAGARLPYAAAAADALPTVEQCTGSTPSPGVAPSVALQADLRRRLGMLDEADALTGKPPADPEQHSHHSLVRGHTAVDRGDLIEARRLFDDATVEAQAAGNPELGALAATQRLALSCSPAERAVWSSYLRSQLPASARAATEWRSAMARSLACEGKLGDAAAFQRQVTAELGDVRTSAAGTAWLDLARIQLAQGELGTADGSAQRAAAVLSQVYGARHPATRSARLLSAEAQLETPATRAAAADAIARISSELAERTEPDAVRARALLLQGRLAQARGDRDEALRLVQRASQEYEAALGGAHPDLAIATLATGDLLLAAGRNPDAEASYRQVAAIYDSLGYAEAARLAHARAGIQLARWGNRVPADASELLHWGLAPTGGAIDPGVAGWLAEQLGQRAAARGDASAALAQYRLATTAYQASGDQRGLASATTRGALLAAELRDPGARTLIEQALRGPAAAEATPHLEAALARLLWPAQRDRARALARAALAALPASSADAVELRRWLTRREAER